jgi:hypothetical protein
MPNREARDASVPSPCVGVCRLDDTDRYCVGCLRTLDEIARWAGMTREERLRVIAELPARRRRENG